MGSVDNVNGTMPPGTPGNRTNVSAPLRLDSNTETSDCRNSNINTTS